MSSPFRRLNFQIFFTFLFLGVFLLAGCSGHNIKPRRRNAASAAVASGHKNTSIQGSLAPLYSRLPSKMPEAATESLTPQSELSLAASEKLGPRLKAEFTNATLRFGAPVFIRIFKESRELELWVQRGERFYLFKKYRVANISGSIGPKLREGDQQAPEGFYLVTPERMNPWSHFHLAFNIGYPNEYDLEHGASGNMIMVHGSRLSSGCFAMTDPVIEEIYTIVDQALNNGQQAFQVHIFPFRMTPANLQRHAGSSHMPFWRNILRGYTLFELTHLPPRVLVQNGRYAFFSGRTEAKTAPAAGHTSGVNIRQNLQVIP